MTHIVEFFELLVKLVMEIYAVLLGLERQKRENDREREGAGKTKRRGSGKKQACLCVFGEEREGRSTN